MILMVDRESIMDALRDVPDPELPVNIVDLGLVEEVHIESNSSDVAIHLLPTFIGCPALDMIEGDVRAKLSRLDGVESVTVNWVYDPPWSVDRISPEGRAALKTHGVTVPEHGNHLNVPGHHPGSVQLRMSAVPCPFCGSSSTYLDSAFGPTKCRTIYYCPACKNSFEHMRAL